MTLAGGLGGLGGVCSSTSRYDRRAVLFHSGTVPVDLRMVLEPPIARRVGAPAVPPRITSPIEVIGLDRLSEATSAIAACTSVAATVPVGAKVTSSAMWYGPPVVMLPCA